MSGRLVPSKGSNMFSRRHEMLQINIYYIKTLVLEGFFFNKTSKGERKALFWAPVSPGSHKPFHSVGVDVRKCSGQRRGINFLIPCLASVVQGSLKFVLLCPRNTYLCSYIQLVYKSNIYQ